MSHLIDPTTVIAGAPLNYGTANVAKLVNGIISGKPVWVLYTDEDGITSRRNVTVLSIKRAKNGHAIAKVFDANRNEDRTFRLDRIEVVL